MIQVRTTVTRKGQVTVPVQIRDALGIKEGDKVTFTLAGGELRLDRTGSVVQRTAGAIKPRGRPLSAKKLREVAEEAIVDDVIQRMGE